MSTSIQLYTFLEKTSSFLSFFKFAIESKKYLGERFDADVMEKRSELSRSMIICSQREPNSWASMILNDEVSANSILKRVTKHYTIVI